MSEFRCYCGAEVPTWFPNEGDRQYWHEKHAKCKQAPAPPADREREWLKANNYVSRPVHKYEYSGDELNVPLEEVLAKFKAHVLQDAMEREKEAMKTLQLVCDREWKDETFEQTVSIAASAIYWRSTPEQRERIDEKADRERLSVLKQMKEGK